jgi:hypothetical protein
MPILSSNSTRTLRRRYMWRIVDAEYGFCYGFGNKPKDAPAALCFHPRPGELHGFCGYDSDRGRWGVWPAKTPKVKSFRATWRWSAYWQDFMPRGRDKLKGYRSYARHKIRGKTP